MGLVGQSVEQGGGHYRIAKHLRPVRETQVGGDQHRPFLIPFRQDLKKQFRSFLGKRDVAKFVQNEQIVSDVPLDKALQRPLSSAV